MEACLGCFGTVFKKSKIKKAYYDDGTDDDDKDTQVEAEARSCETVLPWKEVKGGDR